MQSYNCHLAECPYVQPSEIDLGLPSPKFTVDRITILSTVSKARLSQVLSVRKLRELCPSFRILENEVRQSSFKSKISFIYPPFLEFWNLLIGAEDLIGYYCITSIELAFDFPTNDEFEAKTMWRLIASHIRKKWHKRDNIVLVHDDMKLPPDGIIFGPTLYFEDRTSRMPLKIYSRYAKTIAGIDRSLPIVRVEWTLNGADSIRYKTGIETASDIAGFDAVAFYEKHYVLERLNLFRLGKWISPKSKCPCRTSRRCIRISAYADPQAEYDWETTLYKWAAAAQVRAYLRRERKRSRSKPGRHSRRDRRLAGLSDKRLGSFFDEINVPPLID